MSSLEAKIVVLGAQGVGKTSLVNRYAKSSFVPSDTPSTVGASFVTKRIFDDDSDTTVRLQIWDTAGQERFRSISKLYYRGANACILCYDMLDESSFEEMKRWLVELRDNVDDEVIVEIVGTKCDVVRHDPSLRRIPLERCITYVAETLYPSRTSTPSNTAAGGTSGSSGPHQHHNARRAPSRDSRNRSQSPPPSKRSSNGFWGQMQTCHEISARDGEGVDELFRVIVRKLVEQRNRKLELEHATKHKMKPHLGAAFLDGTPASDGYFDTSGGAGGGPAGGGSFRVGRDRRSWMGFPSGVDIDHIVGEAHRGAGGGVGGGGGGGGGGEYRRKKDRCCA
ncbi:MAG: hypothetical protein M1825_002175 [Sarcosagium campestre]|nr:MAG: hypothetical protein M1825_002175 [Sarcosagium campestre]